MNKTLEEKALRIEDLRLIDDVLFETVAQQEGVLEEVLQTILEDKKLIVTKVVTQANSSNLYGRGVRLDALCTLGDGSLCNIEVQRANNDNHLKRVRFNASSITVRESTSGMHFGDVVELYVIYISEFDFLGGGKTIYHIEPTIQETGVVVNDGLHKIFVNTKIKDGSLISKLMTCFLQKEIKDSNFPKLSKAMHSIKHTQGGVRAMAGVIRYYEEIAMEKGRKEGVAEGRKEGSKFTSLESAKILYHDGVAESSIVKTIAAAYDVSIPEATEIFNTQVRENT